MPHDLTHRHLTATPPATRDANGRRRFVVVRQRRGIVLIFVVVLLTLLAIMGTAYLATSRIDRQALTGRGRLPGATTPLLPDQSVLARVSDAAEEAVKTALIKDLFNQNYDVRLGSRNFSQNAFGSFRQVVANSKYSNVDAPGRADPHLSSLLPKRLAPTLPPTPDYFSYLWPWIGRPLGMPIGGQATSPGETANFYFEPFFTDPRRLRTNGYLNGTSDRFATFNPAAAFPPSGVPAELTERNEVTIGWTNMLRNAGPSPRAYGDNSRVYPALVPGGRPLTPQSVLDANTLIAGDADGDGIADGGLMPVAINPLQPTGSIDRYLDRANGVVYLASYRVVDNSAKLNIGTALTNRGDVTDLSILATGNENADENNDELRRYLANDPTAPPLPAGALGPNYGFFRANVGLVELVRTLMSPLNQTDDAAGFNPAQAELRRLVDARFPLLRQAPGAGYDDDAAGAGVLDGRDIEKVSLKFVLPAVAELSVRTANNTLPTTIGLYKYRSFGDLLEQQVARQPERPGSYLWSNSGVVAALPDNGLVWLGLGDAASLAAKNGALVNSLVSPGTGESALLFSTRMAAPNVNNNGETPWGWFPPSAVGLWFGWTQDFEPITATPPTINALDAAAPQDRAFHYFEGNAANELGTTATPSKPAGVADVYLPRSPRVLLTSYSGTTTAAPQRSDTAVAIGGGSPTEGLPIGMPAYAVADIRIGAKAIGTSAYGTDPGTISLDGFWYPAAKVSAATGTKEQLWRAYWSAMTEQYSFSYNVGGLPVVSSYWNAAKPIRDGLATTYEPNEFYDAFRSCDRYNTEENSFVADANRSTYLPAADARTPNESLSQRQMALIRSAVAACNTIDLRDNDNDITAMSVDITDDNTKNGANDANARYYARVYGTEKQLVITGVYTQEDPATGNYAAIEIYNPTDIPIQLSAYRLGLVTRTPGADPKTTGTIIDTAATNAVRLGEDATEFLQPGGFVIITTTPAVGGDPGTVALPVETTHGTAAPTTTPEVYRLSVAERANITDLLTAMFTAARDKELVLTRTRRADGVAFTDATAAPANGVRDTIENEVIAPAIPSLTEAGTVTTTLVPVDSVDLRRASVGSLGGPPYRFSYLRQTPTFAGPQTGSAAAPLTGARNNERTGAWRCFYAGRFYDLRPTASGTARVAETGAAALAAGGDFAWREHSATSTAIISLGQAAEGSNPIGLGRTFVASIAGEPGAFPAPAIPIQNFSPFDPFTTTNVRTAVTPSKNANEVYGGNPVTADNGVYHLLTKFPYASPFARDADLLSVPYIGTYKIYRRTAAATVDLYEFVSLPMDAWIVAPDPTVAADPARMKNTVGRFDPRFELGTSPYHFNGVTNEWAARLTDYVSAREASFRNYLPDVPETSLLTTYEDTSSVGTNDNQRFAQDGPVTGLGAANTFNDVPWTAFDERGPVNDATITGPEKAGVRRGKRINALTASQISVTQGLINVNTAPAIVLRQLPWIVDPATGLVDPAIATVDTNTRTIVGELTTQRDAIAKQTWNPTTAPQLNFAFTSLLGLNDDATSLAIKSTTNLVTNPEQLMRLGMLHPVDRGENAGNYLVDKLNVARVSNLATTRSDVFTVYVTVQAWTWTNNDINQARDTRLVGERRSSFIVDRSRINQTQFDVTNLITLPIERE